MLSLMQSVPSRWQPLSAVHEPTTQISPSQQSPSCAQVWTSVWQAQTSFVQSILPQQSVALTHEPFFSEQQSGGVPREISRQESPLQQAAAPVGPHAAPGSTHAAGAG